MKNLRLCGVIRENFDKVLIQDLISALNQN